jgi:hypothetical protein
VLAGCAKGDDDDGAGMAATGTGGALGTGGAIGSGGMGVVGTGGMVAPGTGGMTGASGMGAPGTGGMDAAEAPVPGCEAADPAITGSMAHADALSILTPTTPCAVSACHGGGTGQAMLVLGGVTDLRATLVDKPACEAPALKLVDSQGGDAALANSWLWQKMTAPTMTGMDTLIVQASWGTAASCPTTFGSMTMGFGDRMPYGSLKTVDAPALAKIRNWICSGAPGP